VAYYSKTLAAAEKNYCTTTKELLAVVKAVKHFWLYLYGRTFRLRTDHASLIWLCKHAEPSSQVARWLEILAEFSYRIEHHAGRKHVNADGMSHRLVEDCKQCLQIEKRDGGPTRLDIETELGEGAVYRWEHGHLQTETHSDDVHANPTLYQNVKELCRLQETLPGAVADIFRAKKEGRRPSEEQQRQGDVEFQLLCRRWDALKVSPNGLLMITLAADNRQQERDRVVCPRALRRELIWDTHKEAHSGVSRVIRCLWLRWYWPEMTRDVRLWVRQCEVCQASKHGRPTEITGRHRLYAGRPWQIVAVDLVGPMPLSTRGNTWILVLTEHFTRWADALVIPDATAPTVARALDQNVFCYLEILEQINTDQGAQF